jgi:hypothetical protein
VAGAGATGRAPVRRPGPRTALLLLLAVGAVVLPVASAGAAGPTITPERASAKPGATVVVRLDGWDPGGGAVTVSLCGNEARRGSQDCDLTSGQSVQPSGRGPDYVLLPIELPPPPCPCVVRAADVSSVVVVTAPFDVVGAPTAPTVGPESVVAAVPVTVSARVQRIRGSYLDRLRQELGGPSTRRLILELRNAGPTPVSGVVVTAALGRHASGGAPIDAPPAVDLAPGERRTITVDVELDPPVHGTYVVAGTAFVDGQRVPYAVRFRVVPRGLAILGVVALIAAGGGLALAVARRRQNRARRPSGGPGEQQETTPRTVDELGSVGGAAGEPLS